MQFNLWLVSPSGIFRIHIHNHLKENVDLLYLIFAGYDWKVQSLIFEDNDCTIIYAFILMLFSKLSPEKQNPFSNDAIVQNILEKLPLSKLSFESFASLTKTSISLLSNRILYQDSSSFFLFTRIGYKCLSEMMKMAKIDFQIMKFVTIEDI